MALESHAPEIAMICFSLYPSMRCLSPRLGRDHIVYGPLFGGWVNELCKYLIAVAVAALNFNVDIRTFRTILLEFPKDCHPAACFAIQARPAVFEKSSLATCPLGENSWVTIIWLPSLPPFEAGHFRQVDLQKLFPTLTWIPRKFCGIAGILFRLPLYLTDALSPGRFL
jgi:hypothetical protein